jgi:glycosyltransferase involved in cell wall biosynthesis
MATSPRVTVIVPTFDRERYLAEAIQSVLGQAFTDFELLIVDDGSSDGTAALVRRFADARIHYIHQDHRGISAALNTGLRAARGELVARLDSDDRWAPDLLSTLVPLLDRHAELGAAFGKGQIMDERGRPLGETRGFAPRFPGDSLRSLLHDDFTCNIALLARRACLEQAGPYDEGLVANEDWDMWLRVARRHPFAFVDRVLAWIRYHDHSMTALASPRFITVLETRTVPLDKLFRDDTLPATARAMRADAYANVYLFRGLRWLQARDYRQAAREFALALRTTPRPLLMAARISWRGGAVPVLRRLPLAPAVLGAPARVRQWLVTHRPDANDGSR